MTRQEFIDDITTWEELLEFCRENRCYVCDGIMYDDQKDEYLDEHLQQFCDDASDWRELRDSLNDIPTGYDYYSLDDYGEFEGLDDDSDFDSYKDDVLEWADNSYIFDDDEEEPVPEEEEFDYDYADDTDCAAERECISIHDLFAESYREVVCQ